MSIYIKGMEMPKRCSTCPLVDDEFLEDYFGLCCSLTGERPYGNERLNSCPIIELPPHGRLIDADALKKQAGEFCDPMGFIPGVAVEDIDDAPTIIPADGGADIDRIEKP